jgi:hypothetical protein
MLKVIVVGLLQVLLICADLECVSRNAISYFSLAVITSWRGRFYLNSKMYLRFLCVLLSLDRNGHSLPIPIFIMPADDQFYAIYGYHASGYFLQGI